MRALLALQSTQISADHHEAGALIACSQPRSQWESSLRILSFCAPELITPDTLNKVVALCLSCDCSYALLLAARFSAKNAHSAFTTALAVSRPVLVAAWSGITTAGRTMENACFQAHGKRLLRDLKRRGVAVDKYLVIRHCVTWELALRMASHDKRYREEVLQRLAEVRWMEALEKATTLQQMVRVAASQPRYVFPQMSAEFVWRVALFSVQRRGDVGAASVLWYARKSDEKTAALALFKNGGPRALAALLSVSQWQRAIELHNSYSELSLAKPSVDLLVTLAYAGRRREVAATLSAGIDVQNRREAQALLICAATSSAMSWRIAASMCSRFVSCSRLSRSVTLFVGYRCPHLWLEALHVCGVEPRCALWLASRWSWKAGLAIASRGYEWPPDAFLPDSFRTRNACEEGVVSPEECSLHAARYGMGRMLCSVTLH